MSCQYAFNRGNPRAYLFTVSILSYYDGGRYFSLKKVGYNLFPISVERVILNQCGNNNYKFLGDYFEYLTIRLRESTERTINNARILARI